jgi:hypothetical protein
VLYIEFHAPCQWTQETDAYTKDVHLFPYVIRPLNEVGLTLPKRLQSRGLTRHRALRLSSIIYLSVVIPSPLNLP